MRFRSTTAALTLALLLGGCGGTLNRGVESVHQPVVGRSHYTIDVAADAGGISPADERRLVGWFDSLNLGYGDRISVDDGSGYSNSAARAAVADVAARYGLLVSDAAPVTSGPVEPGTVRVVVTRAAASVPDCPDWSRASNPDFESSTMSNFGCASNSALAAMVANPEDLIRGQDPSVSVDASTAGKAIKTYRERKPTGAGDLKNEATGGK